VTSAFCRSLVQGIPYLLTYSRCRDLLEKLTGLQLVKKFPAFHGTRRFIITLTKVRHLSLSCASQIQSIYPHLTSWRSILILSTHLRLGLPSGLLPSGFPTKTLYTPLSTPIRATFPAHLILIDFITRTILGEEYNSFRGILPIVCVSVSGLRCTNNTHLHPQWVGTKCQNKQIKYSPALEGHNRIPTANNEWT